MKRTGLVLVGLLGALASGCAAGAPPAAEYAGAPMTAAAPGSVAEQMAAPPPPAADSAPAVPASPDAAPAKSPSLAKTGDDKSPRVDSPAAKPLLIYEAQLGVQVRREGFADALERSIDIAESHGGFLLSRSDTSVSIRVPSERFRAALKELEGLGKITRRSVTAQDVSEQYHDLEVRLKNLESVRQRLEQFLARATNVSEALTVGKELENVTRQIDEIKGRLQFLKTRAAYSLLTIALEPKPAEVVAKDPPAPPPPPPPRPARLPVEWLGDVGLDGLLDFE